MADDELRVRLVYDVSQARAQIGTLQADLDRLERPIKLNVKDGGFFSTLRRAYEFYQAFSQQKIVVKIDKRQLEALRADLRGIAQAMANMTGRVVLDSSQVRSTQRAIETTARELDRLEGRVEVDDSDIQAAIKTVDSLESDLNKLEGDVRVDDSQVEAAKTEIVLLRQSLEKMEGTVHVDDSDIANASLRVRELKSAIAELNSGVSLNIDTGGGAGGGGFSAFTAAANALPGVLSRVTGAASSAGGAISGMGSAAGGAAAGLGGIAAAAAPVAIAIGAIVVAVGAAVTAVQAFIGAAQGLQQVSMWIIDLAGPAANLYEVINANNLIFKESSETIRAWGRDANQAFGLTQTEFLQFSNNIGASLKGMGFDLEQVAALSTEVIQLATDIGSAFNVSTQQGFFAIQAALRGEYEQLESVNVQIRQMDVNQKAVDLGLAKTTNNVNQQARALATMALIQERTNDVTGDFGNTLAVSLPNQLKVARAEFSSFMTSLSEPFRETALTLVRKFREDILPTLRRWRQDLDPIIDLAAQMAGEIIPALIDGFIAVGNAAVDYFILPVARGMETLFNAGMDLAGLLTGTEIKIDLGIDPNEIEQRRVIDDFKTAAIDAIDELKKGGPTLDEIIAQTGKLEAALDEIDTERMQQSFRDAKVSVDELAQAIRDLANVTTPLDLVAAEADKIKAEADLRKAATEGGFTLTQTEDVGALTRYLDLIIEINARKAELGEPLTLDMDLTQLFMLAQSLGLSKDELDTLWESIQKINGQDHIQLRVEMEGAVSALQQLEDTEHVIAALMDNPELLLYLQTYGVPESLSNFDDVKRAVDLINLTKAQPELIPPEISDVVERLNDVDYRMKILNDSKIEPKVVVKEESFKQTIGWFDVTLERTRELSETDPEVNILARTDEFDEEATRIENDMIKIDESEANPFFGADTRGFDAAEKAVKAGMGFIDRMVADPDITADASQYNQVAGAVKASIEAINGAKATVTVSVNDMASTALRTIRDLLDQIRARAQIQAAISTIGGFEHGGIITREQIARVGEKNKPEVIVPMTAPWERQLDLLAQAGILQRLAADFSSEERRRMDALNAALAGRHPAAGDNTARTPHRPVTADDFDRLASRIEAAVTKARPVHADIHVPPARSPHTQAQVLHRRLAGV